MRPSISKTYDVAIIGGGLSAVAVLWHMSKESARQGVRLSCVVFEPRATFGSGVAYGTESSAYILNVPASKMSIDDDAPDSFVAWLAAAGYSFGPGDFVPRSVYRSYLAALLEKLKGGSLHIDIVQQRVDRVQKRSEHQFQVDTEAGVSYLAAQFVLAVGNSPVAKVGAASERNVLKNPWSTGDIAEAARGKTVALVGTGLTAVDTVLALEQSGYGGSYTLVSRRGLLPQSHSHEPASRPVPADGAQRLKGAGTVRGLLGEFRHLVASGVSWSALLDVLRPHSHEIWRGLSVKEKRRFIRHLRPYWDSHRHRIPEQSHALVSQLQRSGRLTVIRGRVDAYRSEQGKTWLDVRTSGTPRTLGPFECAFNCMGIWSNLKDCRSSLIESLLDADLATYDALCMGLRTTEAGQLVNSQGAPVRGVYTLGSLRRGDLWETTAVREIRAQAQRIALEIAGVLKDNFTAQADHAPAL